ncbi:MAG TPA: helix-turn-helix domain-containing protein [Solirubrobacteraceae bacterium]|nr:helix-turn-helix domain-containing protein [Solirubrobacteraceae bacterium]
MATKEPSPVQGQRAMAHPMRARILAALAERERSPVELAKELGASLGVVSYHVRVLADAGAVELARTTARRGAIQHHYRLRDEGAVSGSVALSAERADRLASELRTVVDKARRDAARGSAARADVEVTVLVHRVALS